jgi:hypothetical protein
MGFSGDAARGGVASMGTTTPTHTADWYFVLPFSSKHL